MSSSQSSKPNPFLIWELPEVLLYHVACFASPTTYRAAFLCQKIAPLCKTSYKSVMEEGKSVGLWDLVLHGDYGVEQYARNGSNRRSCKRLRRRPVEQVQDAHKLLKDNTEIAYYYLWELSYSNQKNSLTKAKLCGILNEYGPNLMINRKMSSGGTFLVEICRSKNTTQNSVLLCIQELVERRGAMVDVPTNESANSFLTALCVAAVRAMPRVVEYLLSRGASKDIRCSARFRLYIKKSKYLRCTRATPIEFAQQMMDTEIAEGATQQDVRDLRKCIDLLSKD
jgi:hypothetical protein